VLTKEIVISKARKLSYLDPADLQATDANNL